MRVNEGRAIMTEAQARAALRAFVVVGKVERWIAEQRWEAVPGGWRVRERFEGWHFRVEPAARVRIVMSALGAVASAEVLDFPALAGV